MFYVNDEPEGKFLYIETAKLYWQINYFVNDKPHYVDTMKHVQSS